MSVSNDVEGPAPVDLTSTVCFHPLSILREGDEVTVGRLDDERAFVVLPHDGAELLLRLREGMTLAAAAEWYHASYGERVDIQDFVADLIELGFISEGTEPAPADRAVRWQRLGRAVFSPAGLACYAVLLGLFGFAIYRNHALAPTYHNVFFTHYLSLLVLVSFFGQPPLALVHEAAHALAGRRLGLPSKLSISRRLYYVVFQTTMDGLVTVPRAKRFLPIMAGMLADTVLLMLLTLLAAVTEGSDGRVSGIGPLALSLAYLTLFRLIWQFWFFLQTDIYYLIVTVLGCIDLQQVSRQRVANATARMTGRPRRHDPSRWHPRDRAVSRWYAWLLVAGYGFSIVSLLLGMAPVVKRIFAEIFRRLAGHSSTVGIADSVLFLVLTLAELAVALLIGLRERRAGAVPAGSAASASTLSA
jgi:hypothetical protein